MGQKVHPGGFRLGILNKWRSNWFSERDYVSFLQEDRDVRNYITGRLSHAGLSAIHLRKDQQKLTVDIFTARPGIVIGKSGSEVEALRRELNRMTGKHIQVNINEIKRPELDAKLVAQSIAEQLEGRVNFRRAMKRALTSAMRSGAQGVKIQCGGRLGGAEMSRSEHYSDGRVPLHTLRADIDYGFHEAKTTFGRIGVKVWINRGEVMPEGVADSRGRVDLEQAPQQQRRPRRDRRDGGGRGPGGGGGRGPGGGGGRGQGGGGGGRGPGGGGGRGQGGGGGGRGPGGGGGGRGPGSGGGRGQGGPQGGGR